MIISLSKANNEILSKLKDHYLNNTKQISSTIPDFSIDISDLGVNEKYEKLIGPCIFFLYQKSFINLDNRRITITPKGIEELEPFHIKNKNQIALAFLAGFLGILGTITGVVLTLVYSQ